MGVFSEMAMDQFESEGAEPFQMDTYKPVLTQWDEQSNAPKQSPEEVPESANKPKTEEQINNEPASDDNNIAGTHEKTDLPQASEEDREKQSPAQSITKTVTDEAEQEKLQAIASMSDDEVMMASARRVSNDTEKITRRNMKDCVSEVIQTKCLDDPAFARLVMHPRKSMVNCFKYITRKAWEYVQDEMKADGISPGTGAQGYGCDVPDDLCYQWAEDYFRDPNAKEDQVKETAIPAARSTPASSKTAKKEQKQATAKKKVVSPSDEGQIALDFNQLGKAG